MTPHADFKYYEEKRNNYNRMIYPDFSMMPKEKPPGAYLKLDSEEGKDVMLSVFRAAARGYNGR